MERMIKNLSDHPFRENDSVKFFNVSTAMEPQAIHVNPEIDQAPRPVPDPGMKPGFLSVFLLLTGCAVKTSVPAEDPLVAGDSSAPSQVTPVEAMAIARELATHPWRPFAGNILHGKDKSGTLVNTPDIALDPELPRKGWWVPGVVNGGIPYEWGGFDGPASFDAAIAAGLAG